MITTNSVIEESRFIIELMLAVYTSSFILYKKRDYFLFIFIPGLLFIYALAVFVFPFIQSSVRETNNMSLLYFVQTLWYVMLTILVSVHASLSFKMRFNEICFTTTSSYAIQHFVYAIVNELIFMEFFKDFVNSYPILYFFICLFICLVFYTPYFVILHKNKDSMFEITNDKIYTSIILILSFVILQTSAFMSQYMFNFSTERINRILSVCLDCGICLILISSICFLILTDNYRKDKDFYSNLYEIEKRKYEMFKQKNDLIDMKYHDLKHALNDLKEKQLITDQFYDKEKNDISLDSLLIETGDDTINTILSEKVQLCLKNNIQLNMMVDGSCLQTYPIESVYSLISNIFSNAIEYVCKIDDKENRYINFSIKKINSFIVIKEVNYLKEELKKGKDGLPLSTGKTDILQHGFGCKSINYFAKSNNGRLDIDTDNNKYSLTILLPHKEIK